MKLRIIKAWKFSSTIFLYVETNYLWGAYQTYKVYARSNDVWVNSSDMENCTPKLATKLTEAYNDYTRSNQV